jgi:type IV pilus assembly protein PilP
VKGHSIRLDLTKFFLVLFFLSLVACSNDDVTDLNNYIEEVKARPKGGIEPLPEIKVVEPFVFKPEGLRDPFQPLDKVNDASNLDIAGVNGIKPDTERRKEELEAYSLDTLRMAGTLSNNKGLWGLIKAKDGTIHRVQVGNHMGQNYGKIIRILPDKIELMEIVPDKPGTWREQQASLALAD